MVLPPASKALLPEALQPLLLEGSPVKDLFPDDFHTDGEGKRADYEAVVLLPFVDKQRLIEAYNSVDAAAYADGELARNDMGTIFVYERQEGSTETTDCKSTVRAYAGDVTHSDSHCVTLQPVPALDAGQAGFEPAILPVRCPSLRFPLTRHPAHR